MTPAATNEVLANRINQNLQHLQILIDKLGCPQLQDDASPLLKTLKVGVIALIGTLPGSRLTPPPSPERTSKTRPAPPPKSTNVESYTKVSSKVTADELKKNLGIGEKWEDARVIAG